MVNIDELLGRCSFPEGPLVCAVSGGPDSMAMMFLAAQLGRDVTAIHVDHGLRVGSDTEIDLVRAVAEGLGVNVVSLRVDLVDGSNLEARAREARLAVLPPNALFGHTADDRAETVLLALMRGSGIDGVAAMDPTWRPLLGLRRSETRGLCSSLGLATVDDEHNHDARFRRVRVRNELIPLMSDIAQRDVVPLLDRFADVAADEVGVLDNMANAIDPTDCRALAGLPDSVVRRVLRQWLRRDHPLDRASTERALDVARGRRLATELPGGWRLWRSQQRLIVDDPPTSDAAPGV
jgi:tRNA(Ile)-lysidine synthase